VAAAVPTSPRPLRDGGRDDGGGAGGRGSSCSRRSRPRPTRRRRRRRWPRRSTSPVGRAGGRRAARARPAG
jgi:hypothetical protein